MSALGRAVRAAGARGKGVERRLWSLRRGAVCLRARAKVAWQRSSIDLDVAPDVRFGRRVQIWVPPGTSARLHIGAGTQIDDDVRVLIQGGEIHIGPNSHVRRFTTLNVAGALHLAGDNLLSWGCIVHCAGRIEVGRYTTISEYVTIVDSVHHFTTPDAPVWHNTAVGAVEIGANTWIAAKATIGRGASIGRHCIIGAHAVVTSPVPDGHLVAPSRSTTTQLHLPWAAEDHGGGEAPSTLS